jgi:hypothetical protein
MRCLVRFFSGALNTLTCVFRTFSESAQANVRVVFRSGHHYFRPNYFKLSAFIQHSTTHQYAVPALEAS